MFQKFSIFFSSIVQVDRRIETFSPLLFNLELWIDEKRMNWMKPGLIQASTMSMGMILLNAAIEVDWKRIQLHILPETNQNCKLQRKLHSSPTRAEWKRQN